MLQPELDMIMGRGYYKVMLNGPSSGLSLLITQSSAPPGGYLTHFSQFSASF